jgi:hypothetical protein
MSNHKYHLQYMVAMKKLHGSNGKRTCQHPECGTVTLAKYCKKHKPADESGE